MNTSFKQKRKTNQRAERHRNRRFKINIQKVRLKVLGFIGLCLQKGRIINHLGIFFSG